MDTVGTKGTKAGGSELGQSLLRRLASPSKVFLSPESCFDCRHIADETLACISNLDNTMDTSLFPNGIGPSADAQLKKMTNETLDFSMSFTTPKNDNEELNKLHLKGGPDFSAPLPESSICDEKRHVMVGSNSTFDIGKGLKVVSLGSDSTKVLNCLKAEPNITFEKSQELEGNSSERNYTVSTTNGSLQGNYEKHLNSTIDIYGSSNVTTEQSNEKLDSAVDITYSNVSNPEQCNERLVYGENCEKHSTFTKEVNVSIDLTGAVVQNIEEGAVLSGPSDVVSIADVSVVNEVADCSSRTVNLYETENKGEDRQGQFQRRNGVSHSDGHLSLNISHCSIFSLDDTLDMKSHALVTSTPIVLSRGFDRMGSAKLTDIPRKHSVINSIDTQSTNDLDGISEHDGFDAPETCQSSTKSDMQELSAKSTSVSKSAAVNKPPSKLAVRRKIPQLKSSIPKTQIPISQGTSVILNSQGAPTASALNQPKTSVSSLHSLRTVQLNKRKNIGPAKSMTTSSARLSATTSSSGYNFNADSKPLDSWMTRVKKTSLPPPDQRRLGLKPPGSGTLSGETGQYQSSSKPSGLTGARTSSAQKYGNGDALPLTKRKKCDMQDQPTSTEAPGGSACKIIMASKDSRIKGTSTGHVTCIAFRGENAQIQDLLQELGSIPADCEKCAPFLQKIETFLEEFRRWQAAHQ